MPQKNFTYRNIGILSAGMSRLSEDIATLTGAAVSYRPSGMVGGCDAIAGWGHKPTSARARALAARKGLPYLAIEDGFLRSVRPGAASPALSYVIDDRGIYYDARQPSLLETLIEERRQLSAVERARADAAIALLRWLRLSKYNDAPLADGPLTAASKGTRVLVVDQTAGDASIEGGLATGETFARMLNAAIVENPGSTIMVKLHPESVSGRKRGHLGTLARERGVEVIDTACCPWDLLEAVERVYTVSSQLGFEALMAGKRVTCFGVPFYAGWGLTDDRGQVPERRRGGIELAGLFTATYFDYARYLCAYTREPVDFETVAGQLAFLRDRFLENGPTVCLGISGWKRDAVNALLAGPAGMPIHCRSAEDTLDQAKSRGARIVSWASKEPEGLVAAAEAAGIATLRMEDGFLRSVGLGAAFNLPASLVLDGSGIYFDATRTSDFERLGNSFEIDDALRARACRLRESIIALRLSKYNLRGNPLPDLPRDRHVVLVPGQVESDASIRTGSPVIKTNLELLKAARQRNPDSFIIYKPHPDVEAGLRPGRIARADTDLYADLVITHANMADLLEVCHQVETITSLTGFEALLRGVPVVTHGIPFYAGWGLTEDLCPTPRRLRRLGLDELTALALIVYPRYLDPVTLLPCPPEIVIERLAEQLHQPVTLRQRISGKLRHGWVWATHRIVGPAIRMGKKLLGRRD